MPVTLDALSQLFTACTDGQWLWRHSTIYACAGIGI